MPRPQITKISFISPLENANKNIIIFHQFYHILPLTLSEGIHEYFLVSVIEKCHQLRHREKVLENFRNFISQEEPDRIFIWSAYLFYFNLLFK